MEFLSLEAINNVKVTRDSDETGIPGIMMQITDIHIFSWFLGAYLENNHS